MRDIDDQFLTYLEQEEEEEAEAASQVSSQDDDSVSLSMPSLGGNGNSYDDSTINDTINDSTDAAVSITSAG